MRILLAAHGYPPTHADGAEQRAERTALALRALGHDVSVLAVERVDSRQEVRETSRQDGITVHRLYYDVAEGNRWRNLYDLPFVGEACRSVLRDHPVDVVHVFSGYLVGAQVGAAAREHHARVVVTLTEFWFLCARLNLMRVTGEVCTGPEDLKCARCLSEDRRRYRTPAQHAPALANVLWTLTKSLPAQRDLIAEVTRRTAVLRATLAAADLVISPSRFLQDVFRGNGFDTSSFVLMRQGVALPALLPSRPAESPTLRLGYMGQLKRHKGVDLAVAAVTRLADEDCPVTLDIWGSDSDAPAYVGRLRAESTRVPAIRWNGWVQGESKWAALASIDALVVPSRWYENSPNVILEAFALGITVIATNLGGMAELVEPRVNGLLFELDDLEGLCGLLRGLVSDRSLLRASSRCAGGIRSSDQEAEEIVQAYARLLDGGGSGAS